MYAYRQGKRMAYLDVLNNGNKLSNEAREKIKEIDAKYRKKIKKISRSSAMRFWDRGMRDNGSKKP